MGWVGYGMMALQAYSALKGSEGGGSGGGGGGGGTKALEDAMRDQTATKATERPLEEIKPATDTTEQTAEYFARMADAIESNGSVQKLARMLEDDMKTFQGGRIEPGIVTPGEAKVPKVQAVKLAELEQQEEEQEEEKERSSFVNLRDFR
jgi:hypothetical protein